MAGTPLNSPRPTGSPSAKAPVAGTSLGPAEARPRLRGEDQGRGQGGASPGVTGVLSRGEDTHTHSQRDRVDTGGEASGRAAAGLGLGPQPPPCLLGHAASEHPVGGLSKRVHPGNRPQNRTDVPQGRRRQEALRNPQNREPSGFAAAERGAEQREAGASRCLSEGRRQRANQARAEPS